MEPATRRALRWVAGIAGAVVLLGAGFVTILAVQLSGGWDEVFDRSNPMPQDPEVVAVRAAAADRLVVELDRIAGAVVVPALVDGRVAREARGSGADSTEPSDPAAQCSIGQHDWKRDDPYDLRCWERAGAVVAARATGDPGQLAALDAALTRDGWQPDGVVLDPGAAGPAGTAGRAVAEYRRANGTELLRVVVAPPEPDVSGVPAGPDEVLVLLDMQVESIDA